MDSCFDTFNSEHSLSHKDYHYYNTVSEAMFKTIKTGFIKGETFDMAEKLRQHFAVYKDSYNHQRLHLSLGYLMPVEYIK